MLLMTRLTTFAAVLSVSLMTAGIVIEKAHAQEQAQDPAMASSAAGDDEAADDILRARGMAPDPAVATSVQQAERSAGQRAVKKAGKRPQKDAQEAQQKKPEDDPAYDPNYDPKAPIQSIFYVTEKAKVTVQSAKMIRACKATPEQCSVESYELRFDRRLVNNRDAVSPFLMVVHHRPAKDGKSNYEYVGGDTFEDASGNTLVDAHGVPVRGLTWGQYYVTMLKLDISWDQMWGSMLAAREVMAGVVTLGSAYGMYRLMLLLAKPPAKLKVPLIKEPLAFRAALRDSKLLAPTAWGARQVIRWHVKSGGFTTLMVVMGEAGMAFSFDRGVNYVFDQVHFYDAARRDWLYRVIPGAWNQIDKNITFDDTAFQELSLWNKVAGAEVNGRKATTEQLTGKTPEQLEKEIPKLNVVHDVKKVSESMSYIGNVFNYFFNEYFYEDTADRR